MSIIQTSTKKTAIPLLTPTAASTRLFYKHCCYAFNQLIIYHSKDKQLIQQYCASQTDSSRNQQVLLNGSNSSWISVTSGVPQGTALGRGPLLFLLYINDITHNIQSSIRLFADDCILYRHIKPGNDRTVLQQDIHALSLWANTWLMHFNSSKCFILCMNRSKVKPAVNYFLDGQPLSLVD